MQTVKITCGGDVAKMQWDPAEPSRHIVLNGETTQYITGDAKHDVRRAVGLVLPLCWEGVGTEDVEIEEER